MGALHGSGSGQGHAHGFEASSARAQSHRWRLGILAVVMGVVALVEVVGGLVTGSLALLADAAHALTDVLALGLALFASHLVAKSVESPRKTFGYHRAEVLAAFGNAVLLGVLGVFIIIEAVERWADPQEIDGLLASYFAMGILAAEVLGIFALRRASGESLSLRSALLHLIGDMVSTLGVMAAGFAIHYGGVGYVWIDAAVSIGIAAILGFWAWRLIGETSHILMEGTPLEIDTNALRSAVRQMDGIRDIHDLHVWTLTSGLHTMSAHIVAEEVDPSPALAARVRHALEAQFQISHVTLQLEDPRDPCADAHT